LQDIVYYNPLKTLKGGTNMTKAELVTAIAKGAGITKKQADAALKAAVEAVSNALKKGERVAIPGFGIFSVRERAARKGRNPRTGDVIDIPARKVVVFKPAKDMREGVK
jgi:DNA-binding protein HU-beta